MNHFGPDVYISLQVLLEELQKPNAMGKVSQPPKLLKEKYTSGITDLMKKNISLLFNNTKSNL